MRHYTEETTKQLEKEHAELLEIITKQLGHGKRDVIRLLKIEEELNFQEHNQALENEEEIK